MVGGNCTARRVTLRAATIIFLSIIHVVVARDYVVKPTGRQQGVVPELMGVGFSFANDKSNTFTWMKYLNSNLGRIFVSPLSAAWDSEDADVPSRLTWNWRKFAGNTQSESRFNAYGDQFGVSFGGKVVGDLGTWQDAAFELRSLPGIGDFFEWLLNQKPIDWETVLKPLTSSGSRVAYVDQIGIPENYIRGMQQEGINIMALWDVRCASLPYISTDRNDPEYWKERWETYRLMYVGGRWLAKMGITSIELYNEPDKDSDCIDGPKWMDDMRIRSQALQEAFLDHNAATGGNLVPELAAPALSVAWRDAFSSPFVDYYNRPFPNDEPVDGFSVAKVYTYHKYGQFSENSCDTFGPSCKSESGYGLRKAYVTARNKLNETGHGDIPVYVTEFNCFTSMGSDNSDHAYFAGKNVIDYTATAACAASQVGGLVRFPDSPRMINIHKIVETAHPRMPSGVAKNGILFASLKSPFFITSSSKTGEAYRMLCRSRGKTVMGYQSPTFNLNLKTIRFTAWGVEDDKVYRVYVTNDGWDTHTLKLDMSKFGLDPLAYAVVSAVAPNPEHSSTFHGEVSHMEQLNTTRTVNFEVKEASFYMITVPKVTADRLASVAVADATVRSGKDSPGTEPTLQVSSSDDVSVATVRFDIDGTPAQDIGGIVSSVLQLHLESSTADSPQLLLVLGMYESAEEGIEWTSYDTLLANDQQPLKSTSDNFINWRGKVSPMVVGHVTVPPGGSVPPEGLMLHLDVTDAVKAGMRSFMVVRMYRFDQSSGNPPNQLPADVVQGTYTFTSRESDNVDFRPTLFVDYEVAPRPSPPPIPPPPPEPIPYYSPYPDYNGGDGTYGDDSGSPPFDPQTYYFPPEPSVSPYLQYYYYYPPPMRSPPPPRERSPPPPRKRSPPPPRKRKPPPAPKRTDKGPKKPPSGKNKKPSNKTVVG